MLFLKLTERFFGLLLVILSLESCFYGFARHLKWTAYTGTYCSCLAVTGIQIRENIFCIFLPKDPLLVEQKKTIVPCVSIYLG